MKRKYDVRSKHLLWLATAADFDINAIIICTHGDPATVADKPNVSNFNS